MLRRIINYFKNNKCRFLGHSSGEVLDSTSNNCILKCKECGEIYRFY